MNSVGTNLQCRSDVASEAVAHHKQFGRRHLQFGAKIMISLLRLVAHDADHIEERCKSRTAQLVLLVEQFALGEDSQAVSTCAMFISLVVQIAQSLFNALKRCGINVKQTLSQLHYSANDIASYCSTTHPHRILYKRDSESLAAVAHVSHVRRLGSEENR